MPPFFIPLLLIIVFMLIVAHWAYAWARVISYNPSVGVEFVPHIAPEPWTVYPRKVEEE